MARLYEASVRVGTDKMAAVKANNIGTTPDAWGLSLIDDSDSGL
ncbi:MAG: hypothetical protein ACR5K7_00120 [Symbiopectobacterium sp.]